MSRASASTAWAASVVSEAKKTNTTAMPTPTPTPAIPGTSASTIGPSHSSFPPESTSKHISKGAIARLVASLGVLLFLGAIVCLFRTRRRRAAKSVARAAATAELGGNVISELASPLTAAKVDYFQNPQELAADDVVVQGQVESGDGLYHGVPVQPGDVVHELP